MPSGDADAILIVGAGPTGLMAACQLARAEVDFRIIDKAAEPSDKSKALAVHARSLELMDDLGIANAMIDEGVIINRMNVFADGKLLVDLNFGELDSPFPFVLSLPQDKTEKHLIAYLESCGKKVDRCHELTGVSQKPDAVTVTIKQPNGNQQEQTYNWVLACDGGRSTIRHALDLAFDGGTYEEKFVIADAHIDWGSTPKTEPMSMFIGKDGLLALFQIGALRYRVIGVLAPDAVLADGDKPSLAQVQELLDKRGPKGLKLFDPNWLASFKINARQVKQYRHGRVLLAGDAAHVHSPAGGQGMNTGLQDAVNLAWKLALVVKEGAHDQLLDTYNEERHAVAAAVLKGTDFLTKVNVMRNPIGRELRNLLAPILIGQEVVQSKIRRQVSELAVAYRSSRIVFEQQRSLLASAVTSADKPDQPGIGDWFEFGHGPAPGERAPDAHAVDGGHYTPIRLFEAMRGGKHSLVLLTGEREPDKVLQQIAPLAHAVEQKYGRLVQVIIVGTEGEPPETVRRLEAEFLLDPDRSVHHRYGAGSACAYLVRPDGYVGYRGQPPELSDIERYFNELFGIVVD